MSVTRPGPLGAATPPLRDASLAELCRLLDPDPPAADAAPVLTFREYVDRVRPGYRWYRHCEVLAAVLQDVADGKRKRVMVFAPPRHGKSELVSRLFTGYFLYRHPAKWVGLCSYGSELAETLSRAAQEFYAKAGGKVKRGSSSVAHWQTPENGGMWAAGVGGPITGKGFHLGVIDDPVKNDEEASSELLQRKNWGWFRSAFQTREEPDGGGDPDGAVVVIQTRWNELDLAGRMLDAERSEDETPERWHVVCFEAIRTGEPFGFPATCTEEPDWRQPGEALCPERVPLEKFRAVQNRGSYFWNALFQQRPRPPEGGMFRSFPVVDAAPHGCRWVRYWDKAGSDGKGDWTAGVKMGVVRGPDGPAFYVAGVARAQVSAGKREGLIRDTAALDGPGCTVWVEQEPGSGGKESAEASVKNLAGYVVRVDRATVDKEVRARAYAAQAEVGNVTLVRGDWNAAFVAEHQAFPHGRHDDQVDAASGGFNKLALTPAPGATTASPAAAVAPVPEPGRGGFTGAVPDAIAAGGW